MVTLGWLMPAAAVAAADADTKMKGVRWGAGKRMQVGACPATLDFGDQLCAGIYPAARAVDDGLCSNHLDQLRE